MNKYFSRESSDTRSRGPSAHYTSLLVHGVCTTSLVYVMQLVLQQHICVSQKNLEGNEI
jgi:hypothetical protein